MYYNTYPLPIGIITISCDDEAITGLHIEGDRYFAAIPRKWKHSPDNRLLKQAALELEEYFNGKRTSFDVPITLTGTLFQQKVWKVLEGLPHGSTTSYSAIAAKIGRPKAVRAVGTAVGRNPVCIMIPCHRVLSSSGSLGGYVAGLDCKRQLLALEAAV